MHHQIKHLNIIKYYYNNDSTVCPLICTTTYKRLILCLFDAPLF